MAESEENNTLLQEIRQGIESSKPVAQEKVQEPVKTVSTDQAKEEMAQIIAELKQKMKEIDKITAELEEKRKELNINSPKKTERILQEIKVPSLDMLK